MAYFNKVSLLILNEDQTKFLVCEKNNFTTDFITPGGKIEQGESDIECLKRELMEELCVVPDEPNLQFIGEYTDVASGDTTKDVSIKLYQGTIIGEPTPAHEIIGIQWVGKEDLNNPRLSPIIKNKIIPDLIAKNILK
ncbi:MAG: NUDIX hydrolase [Candidatus Magasanikbacteria bacterium GW2011_GWA2_37_8]|uniref:NUDIX hydrolase n=1 Tax=Candidatus Magasanikbacteria bacterium GW2011_GWA2_37_8 TaxID=1619036 RepID=A0A0G0JSM2_9BACT|nr:MAG: NUDIX hydrolase [Candidatus Magasanikbacteria bacterium GW2011_GWA2_37_8]